MISKKIIWYNSGAARIVVLAFETRLLYGLKCLDAWQALFVRALCAILDALLAVDTMMARLAIKLVGQ
jgi:hypothetical protein